MNTNLTHAPNLAQRPPRSPRVRLGGYVVLPRILDKGRADLAGTAGEFKSPWKIIVLVYNPAYAASPNFKPITSASDLDAAETAGNVFLPINAGGDNIYEVDTGDLRCTACGAVWASSRSRADERDVTFLRDERLARRGHDDNAA